MRPLPAHAGTSSNGLQHKTISVISQRSLNRSAAWLLEIALVGTRLAPFEPASDAITVDEIILCPDHEPDTESSHHTMRTFLSARKPAEIEACLSEWLYGALVDSGFPTICIETRHAQRFLSSRPNKTDRGDARGIAEMMRLGHFRPVHVKSKASQLLRTRLIARKKFVDHMLAIEDTIRGLMKVHGLKLGAVHGAGFAARVETLLVDAAELRTAIEPLLEVRNMMRKQKALLDRQLSQVARKDEVCKRLMTISGVGPIVSLLFKATIDDPRRFADSKAVAAHLGLTPRVYQSGEIDRSGHVSKCGDKLMRHALYEAANSHLRISKKWSTLRAWGVKLARRVGGKKACVAVARKLAIIMHRMWVEETDFRFGQPPATKAA